MVTPWGTKLILKLLWGIVCGVVLSSLLGCAINTVFTSCWNTPEIARLGFYPRLKNFGHNMVFLQCNWIGVCLMIMKEKAYLIVNLLAFWLLLLGFTT